MYYKRFHRGLTFTRSGIYTFFLILFIGLIAISTGLSGLYMFLSAGLGGFVVSGILSEKAMRSVFLEEIAAVVIDEGMPFSLIFRLRNRHRRFTVFGLDTLFFREIPRYQLIAGNRTAVSKHRATVLAPDSSQLITTQSQPLKRGHIQSLTIMHVTTFPLGILEKYKIEQRPASILVIPRLDAIVEKTLVTRLHGEWRRLREANEYYGHRPYKRDDIRHIDLKKSAGKSPAKWVVKERKDDTPEDALDFVTIRAEWDTLTKAEGETQYETMLSLIRTSVQAALNIGTGFLLEMTPWPALTHTDDIWRFLGELPRFAERHQKILPRQKEREFQSRAKAHSLSHSNSNSWAVITIDHAGAKVIFPHSEEWEVS